MLKKQQQIIHENDNKLKTKAKKNDDDDYAKEMNYTTQFREIKFCRITTTPCS